MNKSIIVPMVALSVVGVAWIKMSNEDLSIADYVHTKHSIKTNDIYQPDKPSFDDGRIESVPFKTYDSNTLTIEQIEECLEITYHRDRISTELATFATKINEVKVFLEQKANRTPDEISGFNSAIASYNELTAHYNRLTQSMNLHCSDKRYFIEDYQRAKWNQNQADNLWKSVE